MYGYIYLTTNLVNGKKYIGQHKSKVFDSNYLGSGNLITQAIKKYGKKNFTVEVLEWCVSLDELNSREYHYTKSFNAVSSPQYYNLVEGGNSGEVSDETRRRMSLSHPKKYPKEFGEKISKSLRGYKKSEEAKRKQSLNHKDVSGSNNPMYGKTHTDKVRQRLREANTGKKLSKEVRNKMSLSKKGIPSNVTGKIWVTDGITSKLINPELLEDFVKLGYRRGRTL